MSDWREMEAGHELDALIERRKGNTVREFAAPGDYWVLRETHPAEQIVHTDTSLPHRRVKLTGDALEIYSRIPCYSASVDAALTLIPDGAYFALERSETLSGKKMWSCDLPYTRVVDGNANAPALAICRAWLAYKERAND